MRILDQIFKNTIVRVAQSNSRSALKEIVQAHQARFDYIIRVLAATRPLQTAIRDAAMADTSESLFRQQLAALLTAWLSPALQGPAVTNLLVPVTLPAVNVVVEDTTDFLSAGTFLLNTSHGSGRVVSYSGKMQGQDFGRFTGCAGGSGSAGAGNYITQAGVPSAAEASAHRTAFIAAFTRRSQNTIGALNFINDEHVWSWDKTLTN